MRVSLFDVQPDGSALFRAADEFDAIRSEVGRSAEHVLEVLYTLGHARFWKGLRPTLLLVRADAPNDRGPDLEARALRQLIAERAIRIADREWGKTDGDGYAKATDLQSALAKASATGCPLRWRDLAAADDADVAHDVFGIWRFLGIDRVERIDLTTFRPRYLDHDRLPAAIHGQICLEALAADIPPAWRIDDSEVEGGGNLVIRDAENGYVAEIDPNEMGRSGADGLAHAREVAGVILRAINEPGPSGNTETPHA